MTEDRFGGHSVEGETYQSERRRNSRSTLAEVGHRTGKPC